MTVSMYALLTDVATGEVYRLLGDGPHFVGRSAEVAVPLTDLECSRQQFAVRKANGSWLLEPLAASTPTTVDGFEVTAPTPLRDGARVRAGNTELVFYSERPDAKEPGEGRTGKTGQLGVVAACAGAFSVGFLVVLLPPRQPEAAAKPSRPLGTRTAVKVKSPSLAVAEISPTTESGKASPKALLPGQPVAPAVPSVTFAASVAEVRELLQRVDACLAKPLTTAPQAVAESRPLDVLSRLTELIDAAPGPDECAGAYPVQIDVAIPRALAKRMGEEQWARFEAAQQRAAQAVDERIRAIRERAAQQRKAIEKELTETTNKNRRASLENQLNGLLKPDLSDEDIASRFKLTKPKGQRRDDFRAIVCKVTINLRTTGEKATSSRYRKVNELVFLRELRELEPGQGEVLPLVGQSQAATQIKKDELESLKDVDTVAITLELGTGSDGGSGSGQTTGEKKVSEPLQQYTFGIQKPIRQAHLVPLWVSVKQDDRVEFARLIEQLAGSRGTPTIRAAADSAVDSEKKRLCDELVAAGKRVQLDVCNAVVALVAGFRLAGGVFCVEEVQDEGAGCIVELNADRWLTAGLGVRCGLAWNGADGQTGEAVMTDTEGRRTLPTGQIGDLRIAMSLDDKAVGEFPVMPTELETKPGRIYRLAMNGVTEANKRLAADIQERVELRKQVAERLDKLSKLLEKRP